MWKQKRKNSYRGFTLIELIVTLSIVATLAGIGAVAVVKIRGTTKQVSCINNLKTISNGLQLYYNDYKVFPDDGQPDDTDDIYPLAVELSDYITILDTYLCPLDDDTTSVANLASYDPFYVKRSGADQTDSIEQLAIGCPRHRGNDSSTSLFSTGSTVITTVGTVQANGQEVPPDGNSTQRKINTTGDKFTFDDGSTVTITSTVANYNVFLVQSVKLSDGTLYSIIRIQGDGTIDNDVASGSKFEVITPSAIVGVRGTKFTVITTNNGGSTGTEITEGKIILTDRTTGATKTMTPEATPEIVITEEEHTHFHWHADGTKHSHAHAEGKGAHHGRKNGRQHLIKLMKKRKMWGDDHGSNGSDDDDSEDKIVVCHKPGTDDQETKTISASAKTGHLNHGDTLGACSGVSANYYGWSWKKWWRN